MVDRFISRGILDETPARAHSNDMVTFIASAIRMSSSGLALLCRIHEREYWIPISLIDDDSEVYKPGNSGKLMIKAWFAEKEEIGGGSTTKGKSRDFSPPKPKSDMSAEEQELLTRIQSSGSQMIRPSKALISLEQRGFIVREGSGVETMWRIK